MVEGVSCAVVEESDREKEPLRTGRGRRWSDAEKAAIVAESLEPGVVVTALARRLGLRPEQIHDWRRALREGRLAVSAGGGSPAFAPVVLTPPPTATGATPIEIEVAGVVVRLHGVIDVDLAARLAMALKARV
jgi:transposase